MIARAVSRRPRPFVGLALLALMATMLVPPAVTAHGPDPILGGGLYAQNLALEYRWASGATPPSAVRTAIVDAADDADASRAAKAPTFGYDGTAGNAVAYGGSVPCGVNGIACMRRDAAGDWFGVWFRPHGTWFDWGQLRWCQMLTTVTNGCYDVENVMLDELGHVLVLDHHDNYADDSDYLDAVVQTVSRTRAKSGWNAHAFGRCDVATLQRQYDVLTWSTRYSTCLDIPTTLALSADDASIPYGGTATFTATLRTADDLGRVSLNPVAGRTVVLQRRAGGSTWSDIATMAAGSTAGTYRASLDLTSTGDWRAVFRKPSTEGLRGSTSGIVTVTVSGGCTSSPCPLRLPGRGER